jgi:hypothetical protein
MGEYLDAGAIIELTELYGLGWCFVATGSGPSYSFRLFF